jgi:hypothetical protein
MPTKIKPLNGYAWKITKNKVDTAMPWNWTDHMVEVNSPDDVDWSDGIKFRLKDDDQEIYCYGTYVGDDNENMFAPLDDYGTPALGAAIMEIKENGNWEVL